MKRDKILAPWQKYAGEFVSADVFIDTVYNSLTGQKDQKFITHN